MGKKDDVMVVSIGVGSIPKKKLEKMKKAEMAMGGTANGKKHMYSAGGNVTDNLPNKGLKQLAKSEKGKEAVRKMGFNV
jgi:hypothetical protein|tara:strand:- start:1543 stop:1779 length:237 start_codon:yes stop_codon:yes gene_type:complete